MIGNLTTHRARHMVTRPRQRPRSRLRRLVVSVLIALSFLACGPRAREEPSVSERTTVPGNELTGRILFLGEEGPGEESTGLFMMNADGTGLRRITKPNVAFFSPSWSPDGNRVLFEGVCVEGDQEFDPEVLDALDFCVVDADGANLRRVVSGPAIQDPAWAPDGKRIVYSAVSRSGDSNIHIIGADGIGGRRLTEGPGEKRSPAWSPDGRTIAFQLDDGRTAQIHVVDAAGGTPRVLAPAGTRNETPIWSHDGRRIAFSSDRSGKPESEATKEMRRKPGGEFLPPNLGAQDLYVVNPDGTGVIQVTSDPSSNYAPVWSPDDTQLAFVSDRDGQNHIYVIGVDRTRERRLTTGFSFAEAPSWTR